MHWQYNIDTSNYILLLLTAICTHICQNGGTCSAPDSCTCTSGWTGNTCSEGLWQHAFMIMNICLIHILVHINTVCMLSRCFVIPSTWSCVLKVIVTIRNAEYMCMLCYFFVCTGHLMWRWWWYDVYMWNDLVAWIHNNDTCTLLCTFVLLLLTAICTQVCQNGGTCSAPDSCTCTSGWTGYTCSEGLCQHAFMITSSSKQRCSFFLRCKLP